MAVAFQSLWDIVVLFALALAVAPWLGGYVGRIFLDRPMPGDTVLLPIESFVYRLLGTSPRQSMRAREYMLALLLVNAGTAAFVFFFLLYQAGLPGDPTRAPGMSWDLAFHSASSFTTNTNYTHFTNEAQVSLGSLTVAWPLALFVAPATGLSVAAAFVRGFVRRDGTVGNFYVDMVRVTTRLLLPLSILGALVFVLLGVPETLLAAVTAHPLTGGTQTIYLGPVSSFQSISLLGSNGGGYYTANMASALADPSAVAILFGTFLMLLLPLALPFAFATVVRRKSEAWPFVGVIVLVLSIALALFVVYQAATNPLLGSVPSLGAQTNGYGVGQETRWSLPETSLFQVVSVYANVGANSMQIGAISPVAQLVLLFGMFTQATPGGVGSGFGMLLVFTLLAIYVGGLMVGRTPEYLGKKIETGHVRWAALAVILHPALILLPFTVSVLSGEVRLGGGPVGLSAHTFTSVLYEFTSESANNGSALSAGAFNDRTVFFNVAGAVVMLLGRFVPVWIMLRLGGLFASQEALPPSSGTLRTASGTFAVYLALFVIVTTALVFLPVMALGPLAQIVGGG